MRNNIFAELALAILGGYLLLKFAFMPSNLLSRFLKFPDVSYGVYLYGWPTQKLLHWNYPMMSPWVLFILSCCLSLFCGLISWHGIEKPFLKLKSNFQTDKR
jgi:peptidoglycan/LPS O-acetylase OafA/YrhL